MNKITLSMMLLLPLSACSCSRTVEKERPAPVKAKPNYVKSDQVHFDKTATVQTAMLRWARPGLWMPMRTIAMPPRNFAMVARDQFGMRLISLQPNTGYSIQIIDVDCKKDRLHVAEARSSDGDGKAVDLAKAVPLMVSPLAKGELARLCAAKDQYGTGSPIEAVRTLRQAQETIRPTVAKDAPNALTADYEKQVAADRAAIANAKKTGRPVVIHDKMP